ncbi:MAG: AzlC family ABC transporter permease [Deltaproteobacteria bacterium]|nr:AzlC family ABC transporter permease [Deltaproteobacteria bacterium]MBW2069671.1 AzlC family ABC transporter permease [Deltaproteobacteria bacterium]
MVPPSESSRSANPSGTSLWEGVRAAWPICLGYFPIGLAFGVLAQKAGLNPLEIGCMSLLVFAGSSQFIAVSMLAGGATVSPIVATTFMVNLRHLLMSSSLAVYLQRLPRGWLSLFAYGITDESFAVNLTRFRRGSWHWPQALALNHTANIAWLSSTIIGGFSGQFIPAGSFGIDYALVAMFICLLVLQLHGGLYVLTAACAAVVAVVLALLLPGNGYIVLASLFAATCGTALKRVYGRRYRL